MGIPVSKMVKEKGRVRTIECMGCGRCVNICPKQALSFHSAAGFLKTLFSKLAVREKA
jgi:ferredoxin